MNSNHNDLCQTKYLISSQEKLDWVTPKISLMETVDTQGKIASTKELRSGTGPGPS